MTAETPSGEMVLTPGKQITIAAVNPNPAAVTSSGGGESSVVTDVALGAAGVGVLVAGGYLLSTTDGNRRNKNSGSTSSP